MEEEVLEPLAQYFCTFLHCVAVDSCPHPLHLRKGAKTGGESKGGGGEKAGGERTHGDSLKWLLLLAKLLCKICIIHYVIMNVTKVYFHSPSRPFRSSHRAYAQYSFSHLILHKQHLISFCLSSTAGYPGASSLASGCSKLFRTISLV